MTARKRASQILTICSMLIVVSTFVYAVYLQSAASAAAKSQLSAEHREARWVAILRHTHEAIIVTDATGTITDWTGAATDMLGWTLPEVVGADVRLIIPPGRCTHEHGWFFDAGIWRRLCAGETIAFSGWLVRCDGKTIPARIRTTGVVNGDVAFVIQIIPLSSYKPLDTVLELNKSDAPPAQVNPPDIRKYKPAA